MVLLKIQEVKVMGRYKKCIPNHGIIKCMGLEEMESKKVILSNPPAVDENIFNCIRLLRAHQI